MKTAINKAMNKKRILSLAFALTLVLGLLPCVTMPAYAATPKTVTIDLSTITKTTTYTNDGITITAGALGKNKSGTYGILQNGGSFTCGIGNFTSIVVNWDYTDFYAKLTDFSGTGWSPSSPDSSGKYTWSGNASSVSFSGTVYQITSIVCTIKLTQTITASDVAATYGDTDKSVSATPSGDGTISYAVKSGYGDYIAVDASTGALTIKKAGTAYVTVTASETDSYLSATKDVKVMISKADPTATAPSSVTAAYGDTLADVTLTNPDGNTAGTWAWADSTTSVGAVGSKTFKANFTPDDTTNYNSVSDVDVTVVVKNKQTITAEDVTATYGDTDKSISASVTDPTTGGGDISYAVKSGYENYITVGSSNGALTITKVPEDGKAYVTVTASETDDYAAAAKDITVTISKADPTAIAPSATATCGQTLADVTLTNPSGNTDGTWKWVDDETTSVGEEVGSKTFKAYFTPTDTTNYNSVNDVEVTVVVKNEQAITAEDVTATYGDTDKSVSGKTSGDGTISYAVKSGYEDYISVDSTTGALTTKKAGTAYVTVTASETSNYFSANIDVEVTIGKADPTVTAPTANTLTYTGSAQALVTAGSTNDGTIYYAVTTESTAPTDASYTTSIPTGTNVGTYYVWYKVVGDDNHNNTDADNINVEIGKADRNVTAPAANTLTYTGSEQELVTAGSTDGGTLYYAVTTESTAPTDASYTTSVPSDTDAGTYYVWYKVDGDDNHNDYGPKYVTVTIGKKNSEVTGAPTANTLKYNGSAQTLITAGSAEGGEMQYSLDGSSYSTALPSETNAGTYIVYYRVAGDSNHDDVEAQTVSVTIEKRSLTLTSASAEKVYDADPLTKEEVEVSGDGFADGEGAAYTFTGTRTIPGESDNTFTYELNAGTEESNYDIELVYGKLTIKDREDEFEIEVVAKSKEVKYDGSSHSVEGFETLTFTVNDHLFTVEGLTAKASEKNAGTYPVKVSGSEVVLDSEGNDVTSQFTVTKVDGELIINKVKASCKVTAAKDLVYNKKAQDLIGSATVKGGTLQYSSDGKNYSEKMPTGTDADKYTVYYRVKADKNHKDVKAESLSVTIDKAEIKITAPTANKLKYNGEMQKLVTEGKTDGGVMEYSLDGSSFGTSVPEAVNIGKYTVYYMAKGDKNYKDSEVMSVQASISKSGDQDDENDENAETLSDETYGVFSGNETFIMSAGDKSVSVSAQGCEGMNMKFELQNVNGGQRLVASTDNYGRNTVFNLSFDESGSNVSADVTCEEYHSKYGQ